MVESTTKNYGWVKPEVQHSPATWGSFLNTDLDSIDALVFANQQGISPVGSITMFAGATPPANWLLCNGAVYNNTSIPLLAPVLANAYNAGTAAVAGTSTAVPNLNSKFPLGADPSNALGSLGGSYSVTIGVANLPAHAHPIIDVAHNHTVNQSPHAHGITDIAHNHGVNQWAHSHAIATGSHSHGITTGSHAHGGVLVSAAGTATLSAGGAPQVSFGNTATVGNLGGNTDTAGNLGGNTDAQTSAISLSASGTGLSGTAAINANVSLSASSTGLSTTQNTGSGTALSVVPSFVALNYIIRYQ